MKAPTTNHNHNHRLKSDTVSWNHPPTTERVFDRGWHGQCRSLINRHFTLRGAAQDHKPWRSMGSRKRGEVMNVYLIFRCFITWTLSIRWLWELTSALGAVNRNSKVTRFFFWYQSLSLPDAMLSCQLSAASMAMTLHWSFSWLAQSGDNHQPLLTLLAYG